MDEDGADVERSARSTPDRAPRDGERARRRARVFGEVFPETTRDERSAGAGDGEGGDIAAEEWLRANVPPHHGS